MVPNQPLCTFMHSKHGVKLNTIVETQAISVSMRAEESFWRCLSHPPFNYNLRPFLRLKNVLTGYHMVLNQPLHTFNHSKHGVKLNNIIGNRAVSAPWEGKCSKMPLPFPILYIITRHLFLNTEICSDMKPHGPESTPLHIHALQACHQIKHHHRKPSNQCEHEKESCSKMPLPFPC